MLTNAKLVSFVNHVAINQELRTALEVDFEGTVRAGGLDLTDSELLSLKSSYRYLRNVSPMELESRLAADSSFDGGAGWDGSC